MSSPRVSQIKGLFAGLQKLDGRSYEGLMQILDYLQKQEEALFPIIEEFNNPSVVGIPADPTNFTANILSNGVYFTWTPPTSYVPFYEIRQGTDWNTATFIVRTSSLSALINPLLIGNYRYLLRSLSSSGQYGTLILTADITITGPGVISITSEVIDNNVLLYWSVPATQFEIDYYVITRDGEEIATIRATFIPITMLQSGTYTFGIYAVDIAGNEGAISTINATVSQPPDYVLENTFQSNLDATRVNCYRFT